MLLLCLACSDYELSSAADVSPGEDVPICEDPLERGDYSVDVDDTCMNEPGVGSFDPVIEWQWTTNTLSPGWDDIMSTPAIGNLTDDDGDGDVDQDDIPDVVFTTFSGGAYTSAGVLNAISGDGGAMHFATSGAEGHGIYSASGVAIGDLEADGIPELCVAGTSAGVVCFEIIGGQPVFKWAAGTELYSVGCPAMADLDGDGLSEVVFGRTIIGFDGTVLAVGAGGVGRNMSFAVDMDDDGLLEVVAGNTIYELDGSILWSDTGTDGIPAVADFDGDGMPEHVRAGGSLVTVTRLDGVWGWSTAIPGGGTGGAPTVADFDGDGLPEVGVAGLAYYTVFDTNGEVLWSNPVSDYSSSVTGSSVFDFEGDGNAEVVYADEHTLWIFDGATGAIEMAQEGHASGTLYEYPLIADVDNDDSTEIIVASNNYAFSGWNGITVIGDIGGSWAPARPVWNQFAYHITNVTNDGLIPVDPVENWTLHNSFRAGGTELGPAHWLPDLRVGGLEWCLEACDLDAQASEVLVAFSIENRGLLDVVDVEVAIGSTVVIIPELGAGEAVWTDEMWLSKRDWGDELQVTVDPAEVYGDCSPEDNSRSFDWPCP